MMLQKAIRCLVYPPTSGPKATIVLRLMAGAVFFWEGLLKFAYANQGVGRFTKLGMPMPELLAPVIAVLAQIMTCIYLLAAGPGPWSLDALLLRRRRASAAEGSSAAFPSSALRADSGRRRPRKYGLGYRSTPLRQKSATIPLALTRGAADR